MSVLELIREGFGDEPDVETFVQKYEVWQALVLNLRSQLDQAESCLNDRGVGPEDLLRARLAEDEQVYSRRDAPVTTARSYRDPVPGPKRSGDPGGHPGGGHAHGRVRSGEPDRRSG